MCDVARIRWADFLGSMRTSIPIPDDVTDGTNLMVERLLEPTDPYRGTELGQ